MKKRMPVGLFVFLLVIFCSFGGLKLVRADGTPTLDAPHCPNTQLAPGSTDHAGKIEADGNPNGGCLLLFSKSQPSNYNCVASAASFNAGSIEGLAGTDPAGNVIAWSFFPDASNPERPTTWSIFYQCVKP
jgi:hypothetical protein